MKLQLRKGEGVHDLISRASAIREAEKKVIEAAKEWCNGGDYVGAGRSQSELIEAVQALCKAEKT